jgi:hypothetical protein
LFDRSWPSRRRWPTWIGSAKPHRATALSAEASVRSALREWQPSMKLRGVSLSFFPMRSLSTLKNATAQTEALKNEQ